MKLLPLTPKRAFSGIASMGVALMGHACSGDAVDVGAPTRAHEEEISNQPPNGDSSGEVLQHNAVMAETEADLIAACVSKHPAGDPFDAGGEPRPDPLTGEMTLPTLDAIAAECERDFGVDCHAGFISKDAARCIAESQRFALGIVPWTIELGYHYGHERVTWGVSNMLEDRGNGGVSGNALSLNAVDGSLIEYLNWESIP